jgi:hydroxymethylbilane synthase
MPAPLRIGTRGSPLALWQADHVAGLIRAAHGIETEIVPIRTSGDRIQDRALAEVGGKALWTKELDRALIEGEIDLAVHSMKDVETMRPAEIVIAAMPPRADVRDRLVGAESLAALPANPRVGTASPRRAAQVRRARPDAQTILFRGNVDTRLRKLAEGEADATLLAAAGLDRLGRSDVGVTMPIELMLPAPAQGAIGIETLTANDRVRALLDAIDHAPTSRCVRAERAFLEALAADCHSPVAALALAEGDFILLRAEILSEDGSEHEVGEVHFASADADAPGRLADSLLMRASPTLRRLFDA